MSGEFLDKKSSILFFISLANLVFVVVSLCTDWYGASIYAGNHDYYTITKFSATLYGLKTTFELNDNGNIDIVYSYQKYTDLYKSTQTNVMIATGIFQYFSLICLLGVMACLVVNHYYEHWVLPKVHLILSALMVLFELICILMVSHIYIAYEDSYGWMEAFGGTSGGNSWGPKVGFSFCCISFMLAVGTLIPTLIRLNEQHNHSHLSSEDNAAFEDAPLLSHNNNNSQSYQSIYSPVPITTTSTTTTTNSNPNTPTVTIVTPPTSKNSIDSKSEPIEPKHQPQQPTATTTNNNEESEESNEYQEF
ncbi:hypothetical protein PPL_01820 [Heterostelium album PN500]|uniref:Uncharacterized protein n=1 Tax=Heterostelium pallidum (strain ATCC 26659 / Pp 5 / PN500) TaxID=670386 RepID=D3B0K3_HETP5|nr:hypothetical protein PPL_01820 [Heterostelium album PN500]EFA84827.1 hypothetical protein PPL_01820 [Heterostelium album PN500]|eukprot:XP_020436938.1 hypothetical protein PPL_01820 [Heterostelium album PN500]